MMMMRIMMMMTIMMMMMMTTMTTTMTMMMMMMMMMCSSVNNWQFLCVLLFIHDIQCTPVQSELPTTVSVPCLHCLISTWFFIRCDPLCGILLEVISVELTLQVRTGGAGSTKTSAGESHGWHQVEKVRRRACTAWDCWCQGLNFYRLFDMYSYDLHLT